MYEILGYTDVYMTNYLVDNNYVTPLSYSSDTSNNNSYSNDDQAYEVEISDEAYRLAQSE